MEIRVTPLKPDSFSSLRAPETVFFEPIPSRKLERSGKYWTVPSPIPSSISSNPTLTICECDWLDHVVLNRGARANDSEVGGIGIFDKQGMPLTDNFVIFGAAQRSEIPGEVVTGALSGLLAAIPKSKVPLIHEVVVTHSHPKIRAHPTLSEGDLEFGADIARELRKHGVSRQGHICLSAVQNTPTGPLKHAVKRLLLY